MRHFNLFRHPYVFIAIEFGNNSNSLGTRVLGVYTDRDTAENKVEKTRAQDGHSLFFKDYGVIKKTIEGRRF